MRALIQRVSQAKVTVGDEVTGAIGAGLAILLGIRKGDLSEHVALLAKKCAELRVFPDNEGRMNRSLLDTGGACLVVSQFTLLADCRKGRRPFFGDAEEPKRASALCDAFCGALRDLGAPVETGRFGAMMEVELVNDGPVTILLDTDELFAYAGQP